jgi:hypothetical protein
MNRCDKEALKEPALVCLLLQTTKQTKDVHIDLFVVASNEGTGTGTRTGATKH